MMPADLDRLIDFLRRAKAATYAAQGDDATVTPVLPDTRQLEFGDGELRYRDIYAGMTRFAGQELVHRADRALWSMSYAGGLAAGVAPDSARPVYAALRRALLATPPQAPIRGPAELDADGLRYTCRVNGDIAWFHGAEAIVQGEMTLYTLRFAGGLLA